MDPREMMYALGGPVPAYNAIDLYRNGEKIPQLEGLAPEDAAGFDRYTQLAQFGQQYGPEAPFYKRMLAPFAGPIGASLLAHNEISKAIPGAQNLIAKITGDESFVPGANTSRPSWHNFVSGMSGLVEGMVPGLLR